MMDTMEHGRERTYMIDVTLTVECDEDDVENIPPLPPLPASYIIAAVCGHANATWTDFGSVISILCPVCGAREVHAEPSEITESRE